MQTCSGMGHFEARCQLLLGEPGQIRCRITANIRTHGDEYFSAMAGATDFPAPGGHACGQLSAIEDQALIAQRIALIHTDHRAR